jgi:hypothetical protein
VLLLRWRGGSGQKNLAVRTGHDSGGGGVGTTAVRSVPELALVEKMFAGWEGMTRVLKCH